MNKSLSFKLRNLFCTTCTAVLLLPAIASAQRGAENVTAVVASEMRPALPTIASSTIPSAAVASPAVVSSIGGNKPKLAPENCTIKNFGKVNDQYFRGSQPSPEDYVQLADIGVKTIIDLRDDVELYAKTKAEAAGLHYINLPMSDTVYPKQETIQQFLELAKDPANFPIYVHCHGGRHRTGVVTAVYRMQVDGWDIDKSYNEMKTYDFYTRWGHKQMKTFVYDYWKDLSAKRKEVPAIAVGEASSSK